MKFQTIIDNHSMEMEFSNSLNLLSIEFIEDLEIDCIQLSYNSYSLILNDKSHYPSVTPYFHGFKVIVDHHTHLVQIQNELDILLETFGMHDSKSKHAGEIYAQIPGLVGQVGLLGSEVLAGKSLKSFLYFFWASVIVKSDPAHQFETAKDALQGAVEGKLPVLDKNGILKPVELNFKVTFDPTTMDIDIQKQ